VSINYLMRLINKCLDSGEHCSALPQIKAEVSNKLGIGDYWCKVTCTCTCTSNWTDSSYEQTIECDWISRPTADSTSNNSTWQQIWCYV